MSGILDHLSIGFGVAFSLTNLLVAAIGSFFGTLVGVLPDWARSTAWRC